MEMMMICTKGERYDTDTLRFTGWTVGDGTSTEGYDAWAYFDRSGRYLGPDSCGIEPEFELLELEAVTRDGCIVVADPAGGVWWPDAETQARIKAAADPEAQAVHLCKSGEGRGVWKS